MAKILNSPQQQLYRQALYLRHGTGGEEWGIMRRIAGQPDQWISENRYGKAEVDWMADRLNYISQRDGGIPPFPPGTTYEARRRP